MPLMGFVAVAEAGAKLEFKINAFKTSSWKMIPFLLGQKTYFQWLLLLVSGIVLSPAIMTE